MHIFNLRLKTGAIYKGNFSLDYLLRLRVFFGYRRCHFRGILEASKSGKGQEAAHL
jgi:hypothetical protein